MIPEELRRLSLLGQLLAGMAPAGVRDVVQRLGAVQRDPTAAVAPTEYVVLWSRLGDYDRSELDRLLYEERELVDCWVHIVPAEDLALHRPTMRRHPRGDSARARYTREWVAANAGFRRYVLAELRRRGPLGSRELEDRAAVPWRTGGWNDGKNVARMLDTLWFAGRIAIVDREGRERIWDLADPAGERLGERELALRLVERQLRAWGVAPAPVLGRGFDGVRARGADRALAALTDDGIAVPVSVDWQPGRWYAHRDVRAARWRPRTTLLSPFDNLIADRARAEAIFGFRYRTELYRPAAERRHGYFVMPILHGDRLIGRVDPRLDRRAGVLHIEAVAAEPDAPADAGGEVAASLRRLAGWLDAELNVSGEIPDIWAGAML